MTEQIKPELVERMVALVREYARDGFPVIRTRADGVERSTYDVAMAIVAELPAPVDPDLLLARETWAENVNWDGDSAAQIIAGAFDNTSTVRAIVAAIKRVRAGV